MPVRLKDYRDRAASYADLLGWFGLVADGVVETYDGHMLACWYFRGEDMASSTTAELETLSAQLNSTLCSYLDGRWSLHVDACRRYTQGYPEQGHFPDRTTHTIDQERRVAYEAEGAHLESVHALTLCWEVPRLAGAKLEGWVYGHGDGAENAATHHDRMLQKFQDECRKIESSLATLFQVRRMRAYAAGEDELGRPIHFDEQLEFLNYCATLEHRKVRLPAVPVYLDREIGRVGIEVEPLIAQAGFATGNVLRVGTRQLVRTLTLAGFPSEASPGILRLLDEMGFEYRWNTRFIVMDQHDAENSLTKIQKRWEQRSRSLIAQMKNDHSNYDADAVSMVQEVKAAKAEVSSNLVRYGHYTGSIIIADASPDMLAEKCQTVANIMANRGFEVIQEDIGNADAFIGTMPGNRKANVRGAPTSTIALADLLPLTSVWAGAASHPSQLYPEGSPPLIYATTVGSTPFRLTPFVDDVGHFLMLGPTGAGKTTALNTFIAQHFRYKNARVFGFDRKYGSYVLCKAAGGDYYDIAGPGSKNLSFAPLANLETPADIAWATEWLEGCCVLQGLTISPGQRQAIFEAVKELASGTSGQSITDLVALLQDQQVSTALNYYTVNGAMGHLLDGESDTLRDSRFMMFEMEHLAGSGEKHLVPVLLYLFRQMEKRLDGSPTFVPLDESWLMLSHPLFRQKLQEWLKTWRSKCANVGLATQEPADVAKSEIRDVVLASCPTRILLANPEAHGEQREVYRMLGCNDAELSIISTMRRKHDYYYKSPVGRRRFSLELAPVTLAFVGASGTTAVKKAQEVEAEFGERWPAAWLRQSGLDEWANYWENVR